MKDLRLYNIIEIPLYNPILIFSMININKSSQSLKIKTYSKLLDKKSVITQKVGGSDFPTWGGSAPIY